MKNDRVQEMAFLFKALKDSPCFDKSQFMLEITMNDVFAEIAEDEYLCLEEKKTFQKLEHDDSFKEQVLAGVSSKFCMTTNCVHNHI